MPGQVIIVGAGAGGLAVAAALGQRGVWYELLERADSIGASWRSRYASLRLHTARSLSGLPGAPISRHYERWVSRDPFSSRSSFTTSTPNSGSTLNRRAYSSR